MLGHDAPAARPRRPRCARSPGRRRDAHRGGVGRMQLDERLVLERGLQLVGALGQAPLVDEQRIREEHEPALPLGRGSRRASHRGPRANGPPRRWRPHRPAHAPSRAARRALDRAAGLAVGDGRADRLVTHAPFARPHQPAHLLVDLVERLEAEVAAARERHAREDLPVGEADAVASADRAQPLTAPLPGGDVPVLLEEGARRQERVGVALERAELERLHDLDRHVVERAAHEVGIGHVAQRIDADQEQHVDLAVRARPQDAHRVAPGLAVHQRTPHPLDVVDLAASSARRAAATGAPPRAARRGRSPAA